MRLFCTVVILVVLGICIVTVVALAADCGGNTAVCFSFGQGADPGPYPGYCCVGRVAALEYAPDEDGFCKDRLNPALTQCGDLRVQVWDDQALVYDCGALVTANACGGDPGLVRGCVIVPCSS
jgi:hypothetical protein